ncbi:hypothetical protein Trydic_g20336 [Trypoxylus dichotomus]
MYGTGSTYTRLRGGYHDHDRYDYPKTSSPWSHAAIMTNSNGGSSTPRRNRYTRASTASVTQMLSDSCSSLLQKLTTRVRGPSATLERQLGTVNNNNNLHHNNNNPSVKIDRPALSPINNNSFYSSARSRIEDKYASVLDKIYGRKKEHEKTLEPTLGRSLAKSATTSNIFLSEKAYPYVQTSTREKTPYKSESKRKQQYPEPPYTYLDRDTAYRARQKSSNHSELRPRRSAKPIRTGKSESAEQRRPTLKLCPVEIPLVESNNLHETKNSLNDGGNYLTVGRNGFVDDETTPTPAVPDPMTEREAKRKEIQSLIMKYSALDEAYNKATLASSSSALTSNANELPGVHQSAAATIAQKYHHHQHHHPNHSKSSAVVMVANEILKGQMELLPIPKRSALELNAKHLLMQNATYFTCTIDFA